MSNEVVVDGLEQVVAKIAEQIATLEKQRDLIQQTADSLRGGRELPTYEVEKRQPAVPVRSAAVPSKRMTAEEIAQHLIRHLPEHGVYKTARQLAKIAKIEGQLQQFEPKEKYRPFQLLADWGYALRRKNGAHPEFTKNMKKFGN